jgi:hypothetical protein
MTWSLADDRKSKNRIRKKAQIENVARDASTLFFAVTKFSRRDQTGNPTLRLGRMGETGVLPAKDSNPPGKRFVEKRMNPDPTKKIFCGHTRSYAQSPDGSFIAPEMRLRLKVIGNLHVHRSEVAGFIFMAKFFMAGRSGKGNWIVIKKTARISYTPDAMFHCLKIIKIEDKYLESLRDAPSGSCLPKTHIILILLANSGLRS